MRLSDAMRSRRDDTVVPPEVEGELEALDAAIRGDEGGESFEALVADLSSEREVPHPSFEAELDAWAAAGFPRGERPGARASAGGDGAAAGFFARLGPSGPRGWSPIAATAMVIVVIGVALTQAGDFGADDPDTVAVAPSAEDGAATTSENETPGALEGQGAGKPGTTDLASPEESAEVPNAQTFSATDDSVVEQLERDIAGLADSRRATLDSRSGVNRGQDKRRVERDAELTLATTPEEVPGVAKDVIDVTEGANGVVLNSQVSGAEDSARATLELRVPSSTLDSTLASLSDLAEVRSRSEQAVDITRSFVTAKDRLIGLRAERDNLAARIRAATTDAEVEALQAQLAGVNRQIADAKNELAQVESRAQLSTVIVTITSDGAPEANEDDGWSLGDALRDAGRVLEVAAGVALISAAVLVPLALIAAFAYVAVAAVNRRARERALDE